MVRIQANLRGQVESDGKTSLALMLLAYSARLMASALGPLEAGLARVTPSMDRAARTLGETEAGALARVHAPMVRGAIWTAANNSRGDAMLVKPGLGVHVFPQRGSGGFLGSGSETTGTCHFWRER